MWLGITLLHILFMFVQLYNKSHAQGYLTYITYILLSTYIYIELTFGVCNDLYFKIYIYTYTYTTYV